MYTPSSPKRYASPAVIQAGQILFCLAGHPAIQMSLTEISRQVGVSGSKAHAILEALCNNGLVRRGPNGKGYALGAGLISLSRKVLDDMIPSRVAEPLLDQLTAATASTSVLGLITADKVYIAAKKEPESDIRVVTRIGHSLALTHGAHGKAIAAFLPETDLKALLVAKNLYFHGEPGKFDRLRLDKELSQCRRDGFACDFSESTQGVNVVAAPVCGAAGGPIGFIEIFVLAPTQTARGFGPLVVRAAKALSQEMGAKADA